LPASRANSSIRSRILDQRKRDADIKSGDVKEFPIDVNTDKEYAKKSVQTILTECTSSVTPPSSTVASSFVALATPEVALLTVTADQTIGNITTTVQVVTSIDEQAVATSRIEVSSVPILSATTKVDEELVEVKSPSHTIDCNSSLPVTIQGKPSGWNRVRKAVTVKNTLLTFGLAALAGVAIHEIGQGIRAPPRPATPSPVSPAPSPAPPTSSDEITSTDDQPEKKEEEGSQETVEPEKKEEEVSQETVEPGKGENEAFQQAVDNSIGSKDVGPRNNAETGHQPDFDPTNNFPYQLESLVGSSLGYVYKKGANFASRFTPNLSPYNPLSRWRRRSSPAIDASESATHGNTADLETAPRNIGLNPDIDLKPGTEVDLLAEPEVDMGRAIDIVLSKDQDRSAGVLNSGSIEEGIVRTALQLPGIATLSVPTDSDESLEGNEGPMRVYDNDVLPSESHSSW